MGEERSNRKTYVRIYTLFNSRLRAKVIPTRIPITACYADKIRLNPSIQFVHFTNPIYRYSTFFLFLLPPPLQYYTNILRLQFSSIQIREKTFELEETRYVTTHQSWKHARNATTHGPFYEDARTTTRRRSGGLNIDRPTVSLPVSDTETGRPRFQLSSLIFHAFTARGREERREGEEEEEKEAGSLLFAVSSMERPLSVLCSRAAQVFLPRAKGKQKTNYKDGHHVTLPTWLRIYIYTQSLVRIMGGNSSLDHLHNKLRYFLPSIKLSYRAFRFFLQSYYIINCFSLRIYLVRGTEKVGSLSGFQARK